MTHTTTSGSMIGKASFQDQKRCLLDCLERVEFGNSDQIDLFMSPQESSKEAPSPTTLEADWPLTPNPVPEDLETSLLDRQFSHRVLITSTSIDGLLRHSLRHSVSSVEGMLGHSTDFLGRILVGLTGIDHATSFLEVVDPIENSRSPGVVGTMPQAARPTLQTVRCLPEEVSEGVPRRVGLLEEEEEEPDLGQGPEWYFCKQPRAGTTRRKKPKKLNIRTWKDIVAKGSSSPETSSAWGTSLGNLLTWGERGPAGFEENGTLEVTDDATGTLNGDCHIGDPEATAPIAQDSHSEGNGEGGDEPRVQDEVEEQELSHSELPDHHPEATLAAAANTAEVTRNVFFPKPPDEPRRRTGFCSGSTTPKSEIDETISEHSSDGEEGIGSRRKKAHEIGQASFYGRQGPFAKGGHLQQEAAAWPHYVRKVRYTRPAAATITAFRTPIDLDAAKHIARPLKPKPFAANEKSTEEVPATSWNTSERATPVGLLPHMRIPGRYGLAMRPVKDVCLLRQARSKQPS